MLDSLTIFAGIAYDPTIRGILAVGVGVVVLMGSVYLMLATNTGNRLGFLLAATGFFGWMAIMGVIWWIYGIGMLGTSPSWNVLEYNVGDTEQAVTDKVTEIDLSELPVDKNGEPDYLLFNTLRADSGVRLYDLAEDRDQSLDELLAPFDVDLPDLESGLDTTDDEAAAEINSALAGIPLAAVAQLPPNVGNDWEFLEASNPKRGEAEATVTAELPECGTCNYGIESADDFIVLDAYRVGGKPARPADANLLERAGNKITNTLRITHPPQYAVVQVRKVVDQPTEIGQAPPTPIADENEPVISVVMVRDIGDRRFPSAMITIGSTLIFLLLCWVLHQRERILQANLANAKTVAAAA